MGIKEVAEKAGVSISTVSYSLNGSTKISEKTRLKIQKIAEEMGYTPKMAARTLKGNKTQIIGVYISGFEGEFYGDLLDGMQHQLEKEGYDMMVNSGKRTQKFLSEKLFDGAIVLDNKFKNNELIKVLDNNNKVVVLDREINHPNARSVLLENKLGAIEAAEYLIKQQLEKYYIISGPKHNYDVKMRLAGAQETFQKYGCEVKILQGEFTDASGYLAGEKIYAEMKQKNVGIFALNDEEATGIYRFLKTKFPALLDHYEIVGFDNNHSADLLLPIIPSVSYRKHKWGEVAAKTLVALIRGETEIKNQTIETHLSFRN